MDKKTWVDLRGIEDYDGSSATGEQTRDILVRIMALDTSRFRAVLDCVAAANDTTRMQERAIRDQMAALFFGE